MALWADKIIVKKAIGTSPFQSVYRSKARMPKNNLLHVYKFIHENDLEMLDPLEERMEMLAELDESREDAHRKNLKLQKKNAIAQDKGKHGKVEALWLGPFVVTEKNGEDSYFLTDMNGEM
ncbi:uncharacterized protein LOC131072509 [Cryptomeria japonica]|uniref:uncharacterized protein LOC131072509 n=1 Tax=Cryptomeria japonica TaxID=3369 RepID=UPI0025ABF22D|nr:uncharacterized protein LOC131072509 [Cryptomeria japonica]